jgi:hypothetical protein
MLIRNDIVEFIDPLGNTKIGIYSDPPEDYFSKEKTHCILVINEHQHVYLEEKSIINPVNDISKVTEYLESIKPFLYNNKYSIVKRFEKLRDRSVYQIDSWIRGSVVEKISNLPIWEEDLIWCPSQCYCYFIDNSTNKLWCIYLRWRHRDPWSAELIPCLPTTGEFPYYSQMPWEPINTGKFTKENDYKDLESDCIRLILDKFGKENITWIKKY